MTDEERPPAAAPPGAPSYGGGFGIAPYQDGAGFGALSPYGSDDAPLAPRGARFWARLIDNLLLLAAMIPGLVLYGLKRGGSEPELAGLFGAGIGALLMSMYQWVRIARTGQTIGKRALAIRVVKRNGAPVAFFDGVIAREWATLLLGMVPFFGRLVTLVDALMIFGSEQRCLHDALANTKVVSVIPGEPAP